MNTFFALCSTAMILLLIVAVICLLIAFVGNLRSRDKVGIICNIISGGCIGVVAWIVSETIKIITTVV